MPTLNPSLVPTCVPGTVFQKFIEDTSINVRWFTPSDPVYFEVLNRVPADLALRQLILAKALDQLNLRLGHQALFPYLIQPKVIAGTSTTDVPLSMIWDMHVSLPSKWERVRLARIKRLSGHSTGTDPEHTGSLQLVFTAQQEGSTTEVSVFQADMVIDTQLLYQIVRIEIPTAADEPNPINQGETETVDGFIIFRALDQEDPIVDAFLTAVAPPAGGTVDSGGEFETPTVYEVQDTSAGGATETTDFDLVAVSHGTGMLIVSATNAVPNQNADAQIILNALNYPFCLDATRTSSAPIAITIPVGLFREFEIIAPNNDQPMDDVTGAFFPVYINRIVRDDASADQLTFFFSTFRVSEPSSTVPLEFASMTVRREWVEGRIVEITPTANLFEVTGTEEDNWRQGFGYGHVVLSSLWTTTSSIINDFFDAFVPVIDEPPEVIYSQATARIASFGISRVPKTTPTKGQSDALRGSRAGVSDPTSDNRYVVEADQGLGDQVDFSTHPDLAADKRENDDIERFGHTGSLAHRIVKLVVNASGSSHDYEPDILPRLRILLGRDPVFGDVWYDGVRFKTFNGDTWVG
jgi:hypothetical protein